MMETALPGFIKLLAHELRWKLLSALAVSDYRVIELVEMVDEPMNLVSYHLKQLRDQNLVTVHRSEGDGRDMYYSLDLTRLQNLYTQAGMMLHPALGTSEPPSTQPLATTQRRVLFVCTQNSARSQMAEALLRQMGSDQVEVFSGGTQPASIHADAVRTMDARGIDISRQRSKNVDEFAGQTFDYVITVCDRAREVCPIIPGQTIHWSLPDPSAVEGTKARRAAFEQTADILTERIGYILAAMQKRK